MEAPSSRSRRRLSSSLLAVAVACAAPAASAASAQNYDGSFALQGGSARIVMHLAATPGKTPQDATLDIWSTTSNSSAPLRTYDTVHTKKIHLVLVSDNLGVFLHLHPTLLADGHFSLAVHVPQTALYHVFADVTPNGLGQQVFRFDVPFGSSAKTPVTTTVPTRTAKAGQYVVTLDSLHLDPAAATMLMVRVSKSGKPADDLHPYLGVAAHAVFIHYADWTYVHVHPESGSMQSMGDAGAMARMDKPLDPSSRVNPAMMLHVNAREPGRYKLWFEFRGGSQVYTAPFLLTAGA